MPEQSICHLAGQAVDLAGRYIQRCLICGEKLLDTGNVVVLLDSSGKDPGRPPPPTWPPDTWVRFKGNSQTKADKPDDGSMPPDNCLVLVE